MLSKKVEKNKYNVLTIIIKHADKNLKNNYMIKSNEPQFALLCAVKISFDMFVHNEFREGWKDYEL